jgi:hypothetical protein
VAGPLEQFKHTYLEQNKKIKSSKKIKEKYYLKININ